MKNLTDQSKGSQPDQFKQSFKQINFDKLNTKLKPEYYNLFQSLGRVNDGVKTLVSLRNDVLQILESKSQYHLFQKKEKNVALDIKKYFNF